jgi:hypothetical protein
MRITRPEQIPTVILSLILVFSPSYGYESEGFGASSAVDTAPMSTRELQDLVAPIALYPDPLLAQILAASTFPDQVAVAAYWLEENKVFTGRALVQAVNEQSWDASVKALTKFPSVLDNMSKNLTWTSTLGEAYHKQPSAVMAAIQFLRAEAMSRGNLRSGPQITVTQASPDTIVISPTNPQVVYVPQYDPSVVYGVPYVTPGYAAAGVAGDARLGFGSGIALGALSGGGCCAWGWGAWNANWRSGSVLYNHNNFYGNAAWHGGYYNGGYHEGYGYRNAYESAAGGPGGYAACRLLSVHRHGAKPSPKRLGGINSALWDVEKESKRRFGRTDRNHHAKPLVKTAKRRCAANPD